MKPKIISIPEKKFIGKKMIMSFEENKTAELWKSFMPNKKKIKNNIGIELYSIEVYNPLFFDDFDPNEKFEKWAAVEVEDFKSIPDEMETLVSPEGLYAVFIYKGPAGKGAETYKYIFQTWLPNSEFLLDNRPHFAVMGDKYKHEDPESEEELWIPVKYKK